MLNQILAHSIIYCEVVANMRDFNLIIYIIFCFFIKGHLMFNGDRIYSNQSFPGDETTIIVSPGGNFKLGFFKSGISSYSSNKYNYYLGISYYKLDDNASSVVWVANREKPITDTKSAVLKILDGNLVLLDELKKQLWSTNIVINSNNLVAVLHDDGNLVLSDASNLGKGSPFWQSFDHPGNIWLPGVKISLNKRTNTSQMLTSWTDEADPAPGLCSLELDPNGSRLVTRINMSILYWTSGSWSGHMFSFWDDNYSLYKFRYVDNENESYLIYSLDNPSTMAMIKMHEPGILEQYMWMKDPKGWNLISSQPRHQCRRSGCGAFSISSQPEQEHINKQYCLDYHSDHDYRAFTTFRDWNRRDSCACLHVYDSKYYSWTDNECSSYIPLQCGNSTNPDLGRYIFKKIPNIFVIKQSPISTAVSIEACESTCLSSCFCSAYAYDDGRCSMFKNHELLSMEQRSPGDIGRTVYIKLAAPEINFSTSKTKTKTKTNIAAVLGSIAIMLVFLAVLPVIVYKERKRIIKRAKPVLDLVATFLYRYLQIATRRVLDKLGGRSFGLVFLGKLHRSGDFEAGFSEIPIFSFEMIEAATDKFSEANKLGEGGFGPVFKGTLPDGQDIAVKRLSRTSGQGVEEFKNEVTLISKVQHWNLVKLFGFCIKGEDRMLVYEYMPNKSLDSFIFGPASMEKAVLDWGLRNKIIEGIARGLLYLHRDSRLKIIHRDLKASNILLDENMNPRISDFGMARIVMIEQSVANTNRVVGTYGYMSPEYAMQGIFSVKSDVFSFGVLLLEIVSGKRNTDFYDYENPQTLLGYAWQLWNEEKTLDLLDMHLVNSSNTTQVYRCINVALLCVQEHVNDRPTMPEVVFMLSNDTNLATPKKPAFCWTARPDGSTPWASPKTFVGSRNEMSNSSVYGR